LDRTEARSVCGEHELTIDVPTAFYDKECEISLAEQSGDRPFRFKGKSLQIGLFGENWRGQLRKWICSNEFM